MIQFDLRLLGTQVLELRVGRGDAGECECGAYDYEATEVDPSDYVWRNGEPIGLAVNFTGFADEQVDWADLEEEWEELEDVDS
jgi:hypothetical protein